jgi:hypothetical protein
MWDTEWAFHKQNKTKTKKLKKTPMPYFLFEEQKVRSMNKKEM